MPIINNSASKFVTESKNITASSGGTSGDVLYTVPLNHSALVDFLLISAGNTNNKHISIQFYHDDDSLYHDIVNRLAMTNNTIQQLMGGVRLNLHQKDKLVCFSDSSGNFDVTISVEEFFDPLR
tara:strand:- start:47 stop:418 length:372 start_codon:yes stop_codon:yes gene_type:complete